MKKESEPGRLIRVTVHDDDCEHADAPRVEASVEPIEVYRNERGDVRLSDSRGATVGYVAGSSYGENWERMWGGDRDVKPENKDPETLN